MSRLFSTVYSPTLAHFLAAQGMYCLTLSRVLTILAEAITSYVLKGYS